MYAPSKQSQMLSATPKTINYERSCDKFIYCTKASIIGAELRADGGLRKWFLSYPILTESNAKTLYVIPLEHRLAYLSLTVENITFRVYPA